MIEDPRSDIPRPAATRLVSIDVLRGLAIVLMAVDHVRVFSGLPAGGPTAGIFFTRWVTHFCAPAFFFLSGTSAFLRGRREETRGALARYLASRGALLVVLELTVMRFAWTFNFDWQHYLLAGVLWALGWSMIALAAIVRLPLAAIVTLGLLLVVGPELFDARFAELAQRAGASAWSWSWSLLYFGFRTGPVQLGEHGPALVVLFALVP